MYYKEKDYIRKYNEIIVFKWHSFMNKGIEHGLMELGISYDTFFINLTTGKRMIYF